MQLRSRITGIGSYLPKRVIHNNDLQRMVDTSDEWIIERTGIRERRVVGEDESASDLGLKAGRKALRSAGIKPEEIDTIIVATISGDMPMPSTATLIQGRLGAKNAVAFDINAACSGFIFGLGIADSFIKSRMSKRLLLIGVEVNSRFVDWQDRASCVLFGDGAGAVVIEPTTSKNCIISTHLQSDGRFWNLIYIPGGGSKHPASVSTLNERMHFIKMKGNETFKIAVRTLQGLAIRTLKENNIRPSDLSLLIPHQANLRIIKAMAERLNLSMDKVVVNLDRYGNTSSASIPIALDEALRNGRIKHGDYIMLIAFGSGLTWGSALVRW
ncbi:MAG: ketoacyl-ACP synthase III [Thermodesulfovibrionia bacterium]